MKMKMIYLVRHATNDLVGKRLAGRLPQIHLNAEGYRQAQALAERLADEHARTPFSAIYSSPLERTWETATPIAERLGVPLYPLEAIVEVDYGEWEGEPLEHLRQQPLWRIVQETPSRMHFPGGERLAAMQMRAVEGVEQVLHHLSPGERAILVSHSDVIKAIVAFYSGLHLDLFQRYVVSPASLTIIAFDERGFPRLMCLNDTAHLRARSSEVEEQATRNGATHE